MTAVAFAREFTNSKSIKNIFCAFFILRIFSSGHVTCLAGKTYLAAGKGGLFVLHYHFQTIDRVKQIIDWLKIIVYQKLKAF